MTAGVWLAPDAEAELPMLERPIHFYGGGTSVTELAPHSYRDHLDRFGARPSCRGAAGAALIRRIEEAGLTGRGGAHLPSAIKWRAVRAAAGAAGSVIVANGAEGEPDSRKDAALLELRPHLVLDGLVCAAETLGARQLVVWLHENAHAARSAVSRALAERVAHGPDEPMIRIAVGPDRYLTGESGAVVQALSGGVARPAFRIVPSAARGVDGLPTLVHNVETLARVARLARGEDCSSAIVTVCADDTHVVLEVSTSATMQEVIGRVTNADEPAAVLIGGHGGTWCTSSDLGKLTLDEADLRAAGLSLGAGVLAVLAAGTCGLVRTAELADFLARQSTRQCGPCVFGLASIAESTAELARGGWRSRRDADRIARFAAEIKGRGACGHPDGAVRMVGSALEVFADDVAAHRRGRCLATGEHL
ncbi:MAG: hypothetical protein QOH52_1016 [Pseudonocardiales bacterium]|nr:hypothetical protein [Pseudonocardiales bacterium]